MKLDTQVGSRPAPALPFPGEFPLRTWSVIWLMGCFSFTQILMQVVSIWLGVRLRGSELRIAVWNLPALNLPKIGQF